MPWLPSDHRSAMGAPGTTFNQPPFHGAHFTRYVASDGRAWHHLSERRRGERQVRGRQRNERKASGVLTWVLSCASDDRRESVSRRRFAVGTSTVLRPRPGSAVILRCPG